MYYEEKWIDRVLCWRSSPDGEWTAYTLYELGQRYQAELKRASDAQATIADLQRQLKTAQAEAERCRSIAFQAEPVTYWCEKAQALQQRVAQLEWELRKHNTHIISCPWCCKQMEPNAILTMSHLIQCGDAKHAELQTNYARVLGLVEALEGQFWSYEQEMCDRERAGLTKEQRTGACIVLHWLNEQIKAASLPAQPAQGGE